MINIFDSNLIGRGYTESFDEGDANSGTYFVPLEESFAGIYLTLFNMTLLDFLMMGKNRIYLKFLLLQKYRLGKSQESQTCDDNDQSGEWSPYNAHDYDFNTSIDEDSNQD